jgi:hypothetical protein
MLAILSTSPATRLPILTIPKTGLRKCAFLGTAPASLNLADKSATGAPTWTRGRLQIATAQLLNMRQLLNVSERGRKLRAIGVANSSLSPLQ